MASTKVTKRKKPSGSPGKRSKAARALALDPSRVRVDGGTQPRASLIDAVVAQYAEDRRAGALFPPIDVVYDGKDYWLWDGFHRLAAAKLVGSKRILARVVQGTQRDAILKSFGANAEHGIRRSEGDVRRSILRALEDAEWGRRSVRRLAEICRCSKSYVAQVRRGPTAASGVHSVDTSARVEGADGKSYPASQPSRPPATRVDYDGEGHPDEEGEAVAQDRAGSLLTPDEERALAEDGARVVAEAESRQAASSPSPKPEEPPPKPRKRTWREILGLPADGDIGPLVIVAAYDHAIESIDRNDPRRLETQKAKAFALSQWHTKPDLARKMAELSNVRTLARMRFDHSARPLRILEPSAGAGALCNAVRQIVESPRHVHITAHEVDPHRCALLRRHSAVDVVIEGDFLESAPPEERFDLVIANTPSERRGLAPPDENGKRKVAALDGLFLEKLMERADRIVNLMRLNALGGQDRFDRVWSRVMSREWAVLDLRVLSERPAFMIGADAEAGEEESDDGAQSDYCVVYLARNPEAEACDPADAEPDLSALRWWGSEGAA